MAQGLLGVEPRNDMRSANLMTATQRRVHRCCGYAVPDFAGACCCIAPATKDTVARPPGGQPFVVTWRRRGGVNACV